MRTPRISDSQMELLATRLAAVGVGRRDFLKVAAGLATMGAAGFNARPAAAAPKLAPGEKLARDQHVRIGGGGRGGDETSPPHNKKRPDSSRRAPARGRPQKCHIALPACP